MRILLLVGLGSFIGGILRYTLAQFLQAKLSHPFPIGTLAVNVIGCFVIGAVFAYSAKYELAAEWRLFLMTGVCGGFTTFSAFGLETISLMHDGQQGMALFYVLTSLILGILAVSGGIFVFK